jgi:alkylation response protein AidB-like acyl-CoA dehydrogenase
MPIELTAQTDAGARLVGLAEQLAAQLAAGAAKHDRDGSYPFEAIAALKAAGYFAAPVPAELGGRSPSPRDRSAAPGPSPARSSGSSATARCCPPPSASRGRT